MGVKLPGKTAAHPRALAAPLRPPPPRASPRRVAAAKPSRDGGAEPATPRGADVQLLEAASAAQDDRSGASPLQSLLSGLDFSEPASFDGAEKTAFDPLRDGPLRYLGYANELGEAFAAWLFAGGVPLSYAVAVGYVLYDTADKYRATRADAAAKLGGGAEAQALVGVIGMERGLDTLVWQLIASVAAPGYTIHSVVALVERGLAAAEGAPGAAAALAAAAAAVGAAPDAFVETFNKSVPTAVGLFTIPFIVHPIDAAVHAALNATLRPAMRRYICAQAGGADAGLAMCRDCQVKK